MRVAITGARGFIGHHLVEHLRDHGHDVVPLGRARGDSAALAPLGTTRDPEPLETYLEGVEGIAHLAGKLVEDPQDPFAAYLGPNVVLTEEVLRAATRVDVDRFVLASSRMVYPSWLDGPAVERCPEPPDSFYGLSKKVAEDVVHLYSTRTRISGLSLRISQVVGPGDGGRGVLPTFVERAREGRPVTVHGDGVAVRDFIDVRDVVRAFRLALERETSVPALNIGSGGVTIRELATTVASVVTGDPTAVRFAPADDEDVSHYSLDTTLAHEQLGWRVERSLADTIRYRSSEDQAGRSY